jgi:hypothetical protein
MSVTSKKCAHISDSWRKWLYNSNERRDNGLTATDRIGLLLIIYLAEPLREFAVEDFAY